MSARFFRFHVQSDESIAVLFWCSWLIANHTGRAQPVVAGGRVTTILSRKAFATVLGDAGGGSARSDYQIGGFLGYQISRRWVLLGGYRYLSVDYRPNGKAQFVYDVDMPGLVIGATFNAK